MKIILAFLLYSSFGFISCQIDKKLLSNCVAKCEDGMVLRARRRLPSSNDLLTSKLEWQCYKTCTKLHAPKCTKENYYIKFNCHRNCVAPSSNYFDSMKLCHLRCSTKCNMEGSDLLNPGNRSEESSGETSCDNEKANLKLCISKCLK